MNKKLIFAIHDLNSRGGQDRSTMEILEKLAAGNNVEAHAFTYESEDAASNGVFRAVKPSFRKPALLKMIYFHWVTLWRFARVRLRREDTLICATGACSLVSDIVHVQFVHASWNRINSATTIYHRFVAVYNLLTEKIAFSQKKNYIAISHSVKRSLEKEYGAKSVAVVHHGVDTEKFCPPQGLSAKIGLRREFSLGEGGEIILLYVGTYERKGLDACIKSLALLPSSLKARVKLLAVGNGDRQKFYSLAKAHGVEGQLILWSPRSEIQRVFQAADIFIFPTLYEPFGMVALEAMACGLPVVISKAAGAAELVTHGRNGYLVENPRDPLEISQYVGELVADHSLRSAMGADARKLAEGHTWDFVAREYQQAIINFDLAKRS